MTSSVDFAAVELVVVPTVPEGIGWRDRYIQLQSRCELQPGSRVAEMNKPVTLVEFE